MNSKKSDSEAVSPVVGVMLMLVVTIIIAAVVSGFAGGLVGGTTKVTQATMSAQYSQTEGMTITHMGGDTISTLTTKIVVSPTVDFGSYDQVSWEVNTSVVNITRSGKTVPWNKPNTYSSGLARTFQPGETAVIDPENLGEVQPKTYTTSNNDSKSSYYGFMHTNSIGQRFILKLVDDSGKKVAETEVTINP
jgi:FlaG/FlaF family flagellin (archaellin)